ncbi:hypothetical protein MNBD_GAMMA12-1852 [hydrothermal vent metagenome]|uniref:Uncharacterized protein n=1 Tax=hydrothermal vent metagenome TaxID=652676 RepID=A0A3B0YHG5_9ZZZZ
MPTKSKQSLVKSASLEKSIDSSLAALTAANDDGDKAIAALSKIAKTLGAESKRYSKKGSTLSRRKKTLSAKFKKTADAATKKMIATTDKEIAAVKKLAAKCSAAKSENSEELKGLKANTKRSKAYLSVLTKVDRILNKPKKKKARKKAVKKVVAEAA